MNTRTGGGGCGNHRSGRDWQNITVKSFLFYGATSSLGSVLQCALFGPISEFIGHFIHHMDGFISFITSSRNGNRNRYQNNRQGGRGGMSGFQGMAIPGNNNFEYLSCREKVYMSWKRFETKARHFVMNHNDLGLCHVAAYHKSYQRASNDVMTLMNASGTWPCALVLSYYVCFIYFIYPNLTFNTLHHTLLVSWPY